MTLHMESQPLVGLSISDALYLYLRLLLPAALLLPVLTVQPLLPLPALRAEVRSGVRTT